MWKKVFSLTISHDLRVIYVITKNAKILPTINTTYRLSCVLVTINALYNISNVASFTADCKTIMLVYHIVSNIQDDGQ